MSSVLGSVEANTTGASSLYSASKAALNSLTRNFVAGMPRDDITVLNIHPGWVRTDMGGNNADIDVETSVTELRIYWRKKRPHAADTISWITRATPSPGRRVLTKP